MQKVLLPDPVGPDTIAVKGCFNLKSTSMSDNCEHLLSSYIFPSGWSSGQGARLKFWFSSVDAGEIDLCSGSLRGSAGSTPAPDIFSFFTLCNITERNRRVVL